MSILLYISFYPPIIYYYPLFAFYHIFWLISRYINKFISLTIKHFFARFLIFLLDKRLYFVYNISNDTNCRCITLPIRDWNAQNISNIDFLHNCITLPMRDWNFYWHLRTFCQIITLPIKKQIVTMHYYSNHLFYSYYIAFHFPWTYYFLGGIFCRAWFVYTYIIISVIYYSFQFTFQLIQLSFCQFSLKNRFLNVKHIFSAYLQNLRKTLRLYIICKDYKHVLSLIIFIRFIFFIFYNRILQLFYFISY